MPVSLFVYKADSAGLPTGCLGGDHLWVRRDIGDSLAFLQKDESGSVWGEYSVVNSALLDSGSNRPAAEVVQEPWQTSVLMVIIICFYCFILYRFRREIQIFVKSMGKTEQFLKLMEEQGSEFGYFMRYTSVLAILGISALGMEWLEGRMPGVVNYYLFAGTLLACLAVWLYRSVIAFVIRGLSEQKEVFRQIGFVNYADMAIVALFYTPFAIVISQSGKGFGPGMVLLGTMLLYHFLSLYKYFRMREFSKFQYILYLCTVEILPVSFVIALAIRYSGII